MRIISGSKRGKKLLSPEGEETRPTLDSVKESIFNIIQFSIPDSYVFDAFGGSGQLALEAVSRGALSAVICENAKQAADVILKNIKSCGFEEQISLIRKNAFDFVKGYSGKKFDLIFLDPPYNKMICDRMMKEITASQIISNNAVIVSETSANENLLEEYGPFKLKKQVKYGTVKVWIYRRCDE